MMTPLIIGRNGRSKYVDETLVNPPGMAHIAGTGPTGETCRTCQFWGGNATQPRDEGRIKALPPNATAARVNAIPRLPQVNDPTKRRWDGDEPMRQPCWEYRRIRRSQKLDEGRSRRVGHSTPACSHWQPSALPPQPLRKPEKEEEAAPATAEG